MTKGHAYDQRRKTDVVKEAIKEATKEWMDEKYRQVGRWTVRCFCVAGFCLFIKLLIYFHIVNFRTFFEMSTEYVKDMEMIK